MTTEHLINVKSLAYNRPTLPGSGETGFNSMRTKPGSVARVQKEGAGWLAGQFWKRLVSASSSSCFFNPTLNPYTLQASFSTGTVSLPSVPLFTWAFRSSSDNCTLGLLLPEPSPSGGKGQEGVTVNATSSIPATLHRDPRMTWAAVNHFP